MSQFYQINPQFYVAIDCIVFGFDKEGLKLLLVKRDFEPCKGEWSLMGGFLKNNESLDEAAQRVLLQLTGLQNVFMEQLHTFGQIDRDPADRVISVSYFALMRIEDYEKKLVECCGAKWWSIYEKPTLIFDHDKMVETALESLKQRTKYRPIGFELLPHKFTVPQLQQLYESIYKKKFDKRNFRKKILSMGLLQKLEEKEKESSKKGAFLYKFDKKKYLKLNEKGFHFEL